MKTILILFTLLAPMVQAQDATPLIRSNTRLVLLDVVVTDKAGNPVRTLTRDDFTVLENGVPQKIASFESPVPSGSSVLPTSPRTIILLDELNVGFADLSFARDRIILFLAQNHLEKTPTSLMTLNLHGLSVLQDYTQDEKLLKQKLTQFRPAMLNPVEGEWEKAKVQEHAQRSINSLIDIARASLGSSYNLNVIWVTGGFAGAIKDTTSPDGTQNGLRHLANLLMSARMRLYTIDPGGVNPLPVTAVATPPGSELSGSNHMAGAQNNDDIALLGTAYEANQLLTILTGMMGGHAYYGRNDVEVALNEAINDGASNYSLSYSPSNTDFKGEYRKIEIHTLVEGTTARTRLGYYAAADEPVPTPEMREAKWHAAIASPLAYEGFALACPLTFDSSTDQATGTLTVKPTPLVMQMEQQSREIIRVAALSKDLSILTSWAWQIDWKKTWTNRVTTASFNKMLPKKTRTVRFLVSDPSAAVIGTCDYEIP